MLASLLIVVTQALDTSLLAILEPIASPTSAIAAGSERAHTIRLTSSPLKGRDSRIALTDRRPHRNKISIKRSWWVVRYLVVAVEQGVVVTHELIIFSLFLNLAWGLHPST